MPTKLKNLKIKRVALVDEGANPDAFVRFAKSKEGEAKPETIENDNEQGIVKRAIAAIAKAFGIEPIDKAAYTFGERQAVRDYGKVLGDEVWPMFWAFGNSIESILTDATKTEAEKAAMMRQSFSEYSKAFDGAVDCWSRAESAETKVEKSEDVLAKMRDSLDALIEKGCEPKKKPVKKEDESDEDEKEPESDEETDDNEDKNNPPVKKGANQDMKFDVDKMSPAEKLMFEDLQKRYLVDGEQSTAPVTPPVAAPAPTTADDGDVYKGLNPAVKAELENLRKFREQAEERQFMDIAKKYTLLGKKPEELAPVLKSLKGLGGTAYDDMISMLDSNLAAVNQAGAFEEIGKSGRNSSCSDAWTKIEAAASEIMKSKPDMMRADAIDTACAQHPELVAEYEKSRG